MADCPISQEEINKVNIFLKGYGIYRAFLRMDRYEKDFFEYDSALDEIGGDLSMARARMFEVRHFILSLDNCDEKLLLYFTSVLLQKNITYVFVHLKFCCSVISVQLFDYKCT